MDLRPYGPGGASVCHPCATSTPERVRQTSRAMVAVLTAAEATSPYGIAAITDHGIEPADQAMLGTRIEERNHHT